MAYQDRFRLENSAAYRLAILRYLAKQKEPVAAEELRESVAARNTGQKHSYAISVLVGDEEIVRHGQGTGPNGGKYEITEKGREKLAAALRQKAA